METQLRLVPFFSFLNKKIPRYITPEYKVEQLDEDNYRILPAPLVMKDGKDFESLYFNFDKLKPEYKEIYNSDLHTFCMNENGNYQLEIKNYQLQKKKTIMNNFNNSVHE